MRTRSTILLLAAALLLGACTSGPGDGPPRTTGGTGTTVAPRRGHRRRRGSPSAAVLAHAAPSAPALADGARRGGSRSATGFEGPVQVLPVPGAGTVVVEQVGRAAHAGRRRPCST